MFEYCYVCYDLGSCYKQRYSKAAQVNRCRLYLIKFLKCEKSLVPKYSPEQDCYLLPMLVCNNFASDLQGNSHHMSKVTFLSILRSSSYQMSETELQVSLTSLRVSGHRFGIRPVHVVDYLHQLGSVCFPYRYPRFHSECQ